MKLIFLYVFSALSFVACTSQAVGREPGRVSRNDCHLSFVPSDNLQYIEVEDTVTTGNDECHIAFKYTGDMRVKRSGRRPAMPEDWRAMTDFSLTVTSIPLPKKLAEVNSDAGAQQHGLFELASKEHIQLSRGDLYILQYSAKKPSTNMIKLNESREIVFVAGNETRSVAFALYSGGRPTIKNSKEEKIIKDLFSSFIFLD